MLLNKNRDYRCTYAQLCLAMSPNVRPIYDGVTVGNVCTLRTCMQNSQHCHKNTNRNCIKLMSNLTFMATPQAQSLVVTVLSDVCMLPIKSARQREVEPITNCCLLR